VPLRGLIAPADHGAELIDDRANARRYFRFHTGRSSTRRPCRGCIRPAGSDGGKLKIGEFELSEADVRGLMERRWDSRRAQMPATAADYDLSPARRLQGAGRS
jgi:hypothetical protein